jgi:CxxC motif-containing protein (DUF1111 family)
MSQRSRITNMSLSHRPAQVALAAIAVVWLAACAPSDSGVTGPPLPGTDVAPSVGLTAAFGDPFANLTADQLALFNAGKVEFAAVEAVDEGLGPVFNEAACATCHFGPGTAVGGTTGRVETRFGRMRPDGTFDPMTEFGGSLIQDRGIGPVTVAGPFTFVGEVVPREATVTTGRITTQLFGLGLVDAVPDDEFRQLAQLEAATSPATAGTPNMVREIATGRTRVGRFGWKAQVPTLHQFSGDAYLNEMGITNPEFPDESCPQGDCALLVHNPLPSPPPNDDGTGVKKFTDFMTLLAAPPRGAVSLQVLEGSAMFALVGCANCHTPALVTGNSPVAALSGKVFQPFSDFLLHDMGSLGDGIVQGRATGRQIRTAPLWGVRTRAQLLHDGRATSLDAAILAHDGQGKQARDRFAGLSVRARAALLAFLNAL